MISVVMNFYKMRLVVTTFFLHGLIIRFFQNNLIGFRELIEHYKIISLKEM